MPYIVFTHVDVAKLPPLPQFTQNLLCFNASMYICARLEEMSHTDVCIVRYGDTKACESQEKFTTTLDICGKALFALERNNAPQCIISRAKENIASALEEVHSSQIAKRMCNFRKPKLYDIVGVINSSYWNNFLIPERAKVVILFVPGVSIPFDTLQRMHTLVTGVELSTPILYTTKNTKIGFVIEVNLESPTL